MGVEPPRRRSLGPPAPPLEPRPSPSPNPTLGDVAGAEPSTRAGRQAGNQGGVSPTPPAAEAEEYTGAGALPPPRPVSPRGGTTACRAPGRGP